MVSWILCQWCHGFIGFMVSKVSRFTGFVVSMVSWFHRSLCVKGSWFHSHFHGVI